MNREFLRGNRLLTLGAVALFVLGVCVLPRGFAERCSGMGRLFTSPGMELSAIVLRVSREALGGLPENMSIKERDRLIAEYARAANEARRSAIANVALNHRIAELQRLVGYVKNHHDGYSSVVCETLRVTPFGTPGERLLVNRGAADGIHVGQAVIVPDGVIGVISECTARKAYVTLLSSNCFAMPITLPRLAVSGVLEHCDDGLWVTGVMGAEYPSVRPKDLVVSSSLGGAEIAANLTVGYVSDIGQGTDGAPRFKVTPSAPLASIPQFVIVCIPNNR